MENETTIKRQEPVVQEISVNAIEDEKHMTQEEAPGAKPNAESGTKSVRPKLFHSSDETIDIAVTSYYDKRTGEYQFTIANNAAEQDIYIQQTNVFKFSRVPYDRLNLYRSQATRWSDAERRNMLDVSRLREYYWMFHLKGWDFMDDDGKPVPLAIDPDGTVSDASLKILYSLPASMLDVVIALFERKMNLA